MRSESNFDNNYKGGVISEARGWGGGVGADRQSMSVPKKLQSSSPDDVTAKDLQQRDAKTEIYRRFEATHSLSLQNERGDSENVESTFLYHIKLFEVHVTLRR